MPYVVQQFQQGPYTYELRRIDCGKDNCTKCPHGPYWYQLMRTRHGKKITRYIGKELPEGVNQP